MDSQLTARAYVKNPEKAYVDWANATAAVETDMPVGEFTTKKEQAQLREAFRLWYLQNERILRQRICEDWGFRKRKDDMLDSVELICTIAAVIEHSVVAPLAVSSILVRSYINSLCPE